MALRLLGTELEPSFQIGRGLAAVGLPMLVEIQPGNRRRFVAEDFGRGELPRWMSAEASRSLAKIVLFLSRPFFKALSQSWMTSVRSPVLCAPA